MLSVTTKKKPKTNVFITYRYKNIYFSLSFLISYLINNLYEFF